MRWKRLIALSWRVGVGNVGRVLLYRFERRSGLLRMRLPVRPAFHGPFLHVREGAGRLIPHMSPDRLKARVGRLRTGYLTYFSSADFFVAAPPKWFFDPFTQTTWPSKSHWTSISEFRGVDADIKCIWEPSRFQWMVDFAKIYQSDGSETALTDIQVWLNDWVAANPANRGPNWACGQETAIRLIHFLAALMLVGQHRKQLPATKQFVKEHCARIAATMHYAIAQDNNHGTSEAVGLMAGAIWLLSAGESKTETPANTWLKKARASLEHRLTRLVATDGSFSQHSTNYHRLLLDSLSFIEYWRRQFVYPPFSDTFYDRTRVAIRWLIQMTDPISGDVPNLGGNDGAQILQLSECDFRDFRPSIQLAASLFFDETVYGPGPWDEPVERLGLKVKRGALPQKCPELLPDGGYALLTSRDRGEWGVLKLPIYRFRPAQADALHLDLWDRDGINRVRDGGSYSYSARKDIYEYFSGTGAHSTCQFDDRDQMPRFGRFLFDRWLKPAGNPVFTTEPQCVSVAAGYVDWCGASHHRTVTVDGSVWTVRDELEGYYSFAAIRWRLNPGQWQAFDRALFGERIRLQFEVLEGTLVGADLNKDFESRYYMKRSNIPVWTVKLLPPKAIVITKVTFVA